MRLRQRLSKQASKRAVKTRKDKQAEASEERTAGKEMNIL